LASWITTNTQDLLLWSSSLYRNGKAVNKWIHFKRINYAHHETVLISIKLSDAAKRSWLAWQSLKKEPVLKYFHTLQLITKIHKPHIFQPLTTLGPVKLQEAFPWSDLLSVSNYTVQRLVCKYKYYYYIQMFICKHISHLCNRLCDTQWSPPFVIYRTTFHISICSICICNALSLFQFFLTYNENHTFRSENLKATYYSQTQAHKTHTDFSYVCADALSCRIYVTGTVLISFIKEPF
jgi:hypothetical protein